MTFKLSSLKKRILAHLGLEKAVLRHYHVFYLAFFGLYFLAIYFLLYYINGLSPFQYNIHFFLNVIGSLSKRFLSEVAPFALIFYLLFYDARRLVYRLWLVGFFMIIFSIDFGAIIYYFFARANFQMYLIEAFTWRVVLTFFTPLAIVSALAAAVILSSISAALIRLRSKEPIWPAKKWLFISLLLLLSIGSPFIPVAYSTHVSLRGNDHLEKAFYRTVDLEQSGFTTLAKEFHAFFFPPKRGNYALAAEEENLIETSRFDEKLLKNFQRPYKKIVLIILESFQQSFFSYYNPQIAGTTPTFDQLFLEYPHIDEYYPSGLFTLFGISSLVCGHTNLNEAEKNSHLDCAPQILKNFGFQTDFIRGATKYYVEENLHFKKFGYDSTYAKEDFFKRFPEFKETHKRLYKSWGFTDNYILNEVADRLKNAKPQDKFFVTALMVDTHSPGGRCDNPQEPPEDADPILFSAHCFDQTFKGFMDRVEQEGLLTDDTAIVITADHPYPAYHEIPGANFQPSFLLRPEKIPLLLITKRKLDFRAKQGSQVDLAATLLNLANVPTPTYFMGKSLLANTTTYPMGQDRENGYMIADGQFYSLSLNPKIQKINETNQLTGFAPELTSDNPKEIEILVQQKMLEKERIHDAQSSLFKWYYNKYFEFESGN